MRGGEGPTSADLLNIQKGRLIDAKIDALHDTGAAQLRMAASAENAVSASKWRDFWRKVWAVLAVIGNFLKVLIRDLSPYIALILVILLLIWISKPRRSSGYARSARWGNMSGPSLSWFEKWFLPSYQIRSISSYFAGPPQGIDRPKEVNGRCDNLEWEHTGGSQSGLCVKTFKPDTIAWTFDTDKMPELSKLPTQVADKMNTSMRMQVYIPWAEQGTFFVPQCSKAYFKELNKDGKEVTTPAGYLFNDKGLVCQRIEKESTGYGNAYRPKDTNDLYDYATSENPKCIV